MRKIENHWIGNLQLTQKCSGNTRGNQKRASFTPKSVQKTLELSNRKPQSPIQGEENAAAAGISCPEGEKKKSVRTGRFFPVRTACYVRYSPLQKHKVRDRSTTVHRHYELNVSEGTDSPFPYIGAQNVDK